MYEQVISGASGVFLNSNSCFMLIVQVVQEAENAFLSFFTPEKNQNNAAIF
jgi:hypothetical protein